MVSALRRWQSIERTSMEQMSEVLEKTTNPFVRIIMEIIRHDSLMHHRVQQVIIDSLTRADIPLRYEELAAVWDEIERHDATEKEVVGIAKVLRDEAWNPVHKQLLDYLANDEEKHDRLLEQLGEIKSALSRATT
jgi:hypothetical protein